MSRIMIVDDDREILDFCRTILNKHGHEVLLCANGKDALRILSTHPVELLVLDISMPLVNGFELIKRLKNIEFFQAPILMLSGRRTQKDVMMSLDLGAQDYMCKPFDPDLFLAKVESLLSGHEVVPKVRFAEGSTQSHAELTLPAMVTTVSEIGVKALTNIEMPPAMLVSIKSPVFDEIGIQCPPLRVVHTRATPHRSKYKFEVHLSFIGLDEIKMQKIRQWTNKRYVAGRKAGQVYG